MCQVRNMCWLWNMYMFTCNYVHSESGMNNKTSCKWEIHVERKLECIITADK